MLLVLKPFALVFLAIAEGIDTIALTMALVVLSLVHITILIRGTALAVGLSGLHLTIVLAPVFCRGCTQG